MKLAAQSLHPGPIRISSAFRPETQRQYFRPDGTNIVAEAAFVLGASRAERLGASHMKTLGATH